MVKIGPVFSPDKYGLQEVYPDPNDQENLLDIIRAFKARQDKLGGAGRICASLSYHGWYPVITH